MPDESEITRQPKWLVEHVLSLPPSLLFVENSCCGSPRLTETNTAKFTTLSKTSKSLTSAGFRLTNF